MSETTTAGLGRRRAFAPAFVGVAVAAFAFIALFGGLKGISPGVTPGGSNMPGSASCVEQYSLETLAKREFAFDGTVTGIAGDEVTFKVNQHFRGSSSASVTLTATGMTGSAITSAGGPSLSVGHRYLVAGEQHFAWACGFTQAYDKAVADQWNEAMSR